LIIINSSNRYEKDKSHSVVDLDPSKIIESSDKSGEVNPYQMLDKHQNAFPKKQPHTNSQKDFKEWASHPIRGNTQRDNMMITGVGHRQLTRLTGNLREGGLSAPRMSPPSK